MKEYNVQIWSYGYETGIGKISKEQYDYWIEREDDLGAVLNEDVDQESEGVPPSAKFTGYYNEYSDVANVCGPDFENSSITVSCDGVKIFELDIGEFVDQYSSGGDNVEWDDDIYISDLPDGHYVYWAYGGKGLYMEGIVEAEEFNPELLTLTVVDIEGREIVTGVYYDGSWIDCGGGEWTGKFSEFSLHEV